LTARTRCANEFPFQLVVGNDDVRCDLDRHAA
jgi:hypothetical protein